jgi:hypothetical protein
MALLPCFDGLLTLDNTCEAGSGAITLQSVGIDETQIGDFLGPEDTITTFLANAEEYSRGILRHDVLTYYGNRINPHTFLDRKMIGQPHDGMDLQSGTGKGGILIEIDQRNSNTVLRLGALGLFADTTGDVTITIYDLEDGSVAATHVLAVAAGVSYTKNVQIELPAYRKKKAYFITHSLADFYRVDVHGAGCTSCSGKGYTYGGVTMHGARIGAGLPMLRENLRISAYTSGLMALVTVECSHAQMLCELRDALAMPYALKVAETIIRRGVHAVQRLNSQRMDLDLLKSRANEYGAEYSSTLSNLLGRMRLPEDPMCFTCNTPTRTVIDIP